MTFLSHQIHLSKPAWLTWEQVSCASSPMPPQSPQSSAIVLFDPWAVSYSGSLWTQTCLARWLYHAPRLPWHRVSSVGSSTKDTTNDIIPGGPIIYRNALPHPLHTATQTGLDHFSSHTAQSPGGPCHWTSHPERWESALSSHLTALQHELRQGRECHKYIKARNTTTFNVSFINDNAGKTMTKYLSYSMPWYSYSRGG